MLLWPAGLALVLVWGVYRDPAIDYRLVVAGAVLPDAVDGPFGGARFLHTLVASVVLLAVVMVATRGRRRARRRWLAVPMGTFSHLLADGVWARTSTFWWPFLGGQLQGRLPAVEHGLAVLVVEEALGAAALVWFWRRFRLGEPPRRRAFLRTGRLPREGTGDTAAGAAGVSRPERSEFEDAALAEPDGADSARRQRQQHAGQDDPDRRP
jgi:hypothetical protein